jgi:hypothetical protein
MIKLSLKGEDTLLRAVEGILLDLPHRWRPLSRKHATRLRRRDAAGLPSAEAAGWLEDVSAVIVKELDAHNRDTFPEDPMDHACLTAALLYLGIRGGAPFRGPGASALAGSLGELEAIATRYNKISSAKQGGTTRSAMISKPVEVDLAPVKETAPDETGSDARVRSAIDAALSASPRASTAAIKKVVHPKLKAAGIVIGDGALRKRIERRRKWLTLN